MSSLRAVVIRLCVLLSDRLTAWGPARGARLFQALVLLAFALAPGQTMLGQSERYVVGDWTDGRIKLFNVADDTAAGTVRAGITPTAVVVSPNGRLAFVTNINADYVSVLDLTTASEIKQIRGIRARTLAMSPDGTKVVVPLCGGSGCLSANADKVAIIDTSTLQPTFVDLNGLVGDTSSSTADIFLGSVVVANSKAYIATAAVSPSYLGVVTVDLNTLAVGRVTSSGFAQGKVYESGIAATPDGAYVVALQGSYAVIISTATNTVARTITLPAASSGIAITRDAADPNGIFAYVTLSDMTVRVLNFTSGVPTGLMAGASINFGMSTAYKYEVAITPDGTQLYILNDFIAQGTRNSNNLAVINTAMLRAGQSGAVLRYKGIGNYLQAVVVANTYTDAVIGAPVVTSVLPAYIENSADNAVVINGANFASDAHVRIGNLEPITGVTFLSSSQIEVIVPAGAAAQLADVVVTNPNSGAPVTDQQLSGIGRGVLTIASGSAYAPGYAAWASSLGEPYLWPLFPGREPVGTIYHPRGFSFAPAGDRVFVGSWTVPGVGITNLLSGATSTYLLNTTVGVREGVIVTPSAIVPGAGTIGPSAFMVNGYQTATWDEQLVILDASLDSGTLVSTQMAGLTDLTNGPSRGALAVTSNGAYAYSLFGGVGSWLLIYDISAGINHNVSATTLGVLPSALHMHLTSDNNFLLMRMSDGNSIGVFDISGTVNAGASRTSPVLLATINGTPCVASASFQWFQVAGSRLYAMDPYQHIVEAFNFVPASQNYSCLGYVTVPVADTMLVDPMAVSPDAQYIYVGIKEENSVVALDASKVVTSDPTAVVTKIAVGLSPDYISMSPVLSGQADVGISISAPTGPVAPGATITYTLTVKNNGPNTATGIRVVNTLPAGSTYMSATGGTCTGTQVLTCTVPDYGTGGQGETLSINATTPATPVAVDHATVSAEQTDSNPSNNGASATTQIDAPDLAISASNTPDPVASGGAFYYDVTVENSGTALADNIVVSIIPPAGVTLGSANGCSVSANGMTCSWPAVAAGDVVTQSIPATAPALVGTFVTTFSVQTNLAEFSTANNSATLTTTATVPADVVVISGHYAAPVLTNHLIRRYFVITNGGPNAADGVSAGGAATTNIISVSGSPGGCTVISTAFLCTLGTLASQQSVTLTIDTTSAASPSTDSMTLSVTAATGDPDITNNVANDIVQVVYGADIAVTAGSVSPASVSFGAPVTFTVTARNNGLDDATNVNVMLPLDGLRYDSTSLQTGCTVGGTFVPGGTGTPPPGYDVLPPPSVYAASAYCALGNLSAGQEQTITITAIPLAAGTRDVIPTAAAENRDPDISNNSATALTIDVGTAPAFSDGDLFLAAVTTIHPWSVQRFTGGVASQMFDIVQLSDDQIGGMAFDGSGQLYAAHPYGTTSGYDNPRISISDAQGNDVGVFGSSWSCYPTSLVFDASGNAYVGTRCPEIVKLDSAGTVLATFTVDVENGGVEWLDLAADGCTIYYTSAGQFLKRYDVCAQQQLPEVTSSLHGPAGGVRLLGDGSMIVADGVDLHRVSASGSILQTYDIAGSDCWTSLSVAHDVQSFWAANCTGSIAHFQLDGTVTGTTSAATTAVGGLTVKGEHVLAQSANLAITVSPSADTVAVGSTITYTYTVANLGPASATNVGFTQTVPANATLVSATAPQAVCSGASCTLGSITPSSPASVTIVLRADSGTSLDVTASVTADQSDFDLSNNAAASTAVVTVSSYTLSVALAGAGAGSVSSSPAGINCGTTCSADYLQNTVVTLTATPTSGASVFAGWTGGGCSGTGTCTVTMTAATSVSANFNIATFPVTVTLAGTGSGSVTSSPAGIDCGSTCSANFDSGSSVTLTATPNPGATFSAWSGACSGTASCTIVMGTSPVVVTATFSPVIFLLTTTIPDATVGQQYSTTMQAVGGGGGSYVWSITAGSLPNGLSLGSDGVLSGTPTTAGSYSFTVQVTDSVSTTATQALSLAIAQPLLISTTTLPYASQNLAYNQTLALAGGKSPYSWALVSGSLPAGLALSSSGILSGAATTTGTFNFLIQATDAIGRTATQNLALAVVPVSVTVTPTRTSLNAAASQPFTATVTGSTETAVTWAVAGAGCSGSACGAISGAGVYVAPLQPPTPATVSITATSVADPTKFASATVTIVPVADVSVTATAPATAPVGSNVAYNFAVTNAGPSMATAVNLDLTIAANLSINSAVASQGSCTISPQICGPSGGPCAPTSISCSLLDLAAGAGAAVTITAQTSTAGSVTNTASVSLAETDLVSNNNSASATTTIATVADLAIVEWDADDPLAVNGTYTYRYTVTNRGPSDASNVILQPTIPAGATLLSAVSISGSWICDAAGRCSLAALGNSASAIVEYKCRLDQPGSQLYAGTVSAAEFDSITGNNTASELNTVLSVADVFVTVASPSSAGGNVHVHSVSISNKGPNDASAVVFADAVTGDFVLSATSQQGSCATTPNSVTCNLDTIRGGGTVIVTISVQAPESGWTSHSFTAKANEIDPTPVNNMVRISSNLDLNTQPGTGVTVLPSDAPSGVTASVTFANVSVAGTTAVSLAPLTAGAPAGYRTGISASIFDLRTSATYAGAINVVLPFQPAAFHHPSRVRLFHLENGIWVDRTTALDTAGGRIAATTASLSPFAIFEPLNSVPVANAGSDATVAGTSLSGATVALNASGSVDTDSDPLTYRWNGPFAEGNGTAVGMKPTVTLPFGTSRLVLVVNDGESDSAAAAVNVTVSDFVVAVSGTAGAAPGGGASTYAVVLSPKFAAFNAPVSLACANLPLGMSCTFAPATVTPGENGGSSVLTVRTAATSASQRRPPDGQKRWAYLAVLLAPFGFLPLGATCRRRTRWLWIAVLVAVLAATFACGGSNLSPVQPAPGTHAATTSTITITATSAGLTHSTAVTITVP